MHAFVILFPSSCSFHLSIVPFKKVYVWAFRTFIVKGQQIQPGSEWVRDGECEQEWPWVRFKPRPKVAKGSEWTIIYPEVLRCITGYRCFLKVMIHGAIFFEQ